MPIQTELERKKDRMLRYFKYIRKWSRILISLA